MSIQYELSLLFHAHHPSPETVIVVRREWQLDRSSVVSEYEELASGLQCELVRVLPFLTGVFCHEIGIDLALALVRQTLCLGAPRERT